MCSAYRSSSTRRGYKPALCRCRHDSGGFVGPCCLGRVDAYTPHLMIGVTEKASGEVDCFVDLLPRVECATHPEYAANETSVALFTLCHCVLVCVCVC